MALTVTAFSYPLLLASGAALSALLVHMFFSHICHQTPERSFFLLGAPLAVCARCIGIYAGAALGAFVRAPRAVITNALGAAFALNVAEAASEYAGWHGNWLVIRAFLGFVLGGTLTALVAHATVEAKTLNLKEAR